MKNLFLIISSALLITSCAAYNGSMSGSASITNANFSTVGIATGTASTTYILGIGGLRTDGLMLAAKKNLYQNANIQQGQAIANVTVDSKVSYFIIGQKHKVTISADIIDFNSPFDTTSFAEIPLIDPAPNRPFTYADIEKQTSTNSNEKYVVNDFVFTEDTQDIICKITDLTLTKARVEYTNFNGQLKYQQIYLENLYRTKHIYDESYFKIGDQINYINNYSDTPKLGKVLAISNTRLKVLDSETGVLLTLSKKNCKQIGD